MLKACHKGSFPPSEPQMSKTRKAKGAVSLETALALAVDCHRSGDLARAEVVYRRVLAADPGNADALHWLGLLLFQRREPAAALPLLEAAVAARPGFAEAHNNRGTVLMALGRPGPALVAYSEAVRLRPDYADAHFNRANLLRENGLPERALAVYERALALQPGRADLHLNHGLALQALDRQVEALAACERAIALAPERVEARLNRGNVLKLLGQADEALAAFRAVLARDPTCARAVHNCGCILLDQGRFREALAAFEQALALAPGLAEARFNRGLLRLATGRLDDSTWSDYEARFGFGSLKPAWRPYDRPQWRGEPLGGRTLLIWREQGLGDELLFATCFRHALAAGGHVILECDPRLARLFARSFPGAQVRAPGAWGALRGQGEETGGPTRDGRIVGEAGDSGRFDDSSSAAATPDAAPDFDLHAPAGSLPGLLAPRLSAWGAARAGHRGAHPGAPLGSVAASAGAILTAEPAAVADWRRRLAALGPKLNVGICWRSGVVTAERRGSYLALEEWAPLFSVPGVRFINLQYDDCTVELARIRRRLGVGAVCWPDLDLRNDLDGTAALIAALDLVIAAPTAVG